MFKRFLIPNLGALVAVLLLGISSALGDWSAAAIQGGMAVVAAVWTGLAILTEPGESDEREEPVPPPHL